MLLGCHTQQKTEGNPDSNLSDDLLPSPPSCPHPCCTGRRGYSCLQKGSRISCCMVGNSRLCRLATGLRQDKFTSLETQQLGPRGVAAELGEISGLSSFSDFFFFPSAQTGCECAESQITLCLALWRARASKPSCSHPGKTH